MFVIPIIFAPLFGYISDKYGKKLTLLITAMVILSLSHSLFLLIPAAKSGNPSYYGLIPTALVGLSHSVFVVCIWTLPPLLIRSESIGTGFGICTCFANIGQAVVPIIVNFIISDHESTNQYNNAIILFLV